MEKQVDLFGEQILTDREKYIKEHNERCEQARNEKRLKGEKEVGLLDVKCSFPCPVACKMPIDERPEHIRGCEECKRLERELDQQLGFKNHVYS